MYEILAIGDAIVDRVVSFDPTKAQMRPILAVKGQFFEATAAQHGFLHALTPEAVYPGGSAANTLRNLSVLGLPCAFLGKVGLDADAAVFEKSLSGWGIHAHLLSTAQEPTGYCMVIVHEDGDRTLCSRVGASGLLQVSDVDGALLKKSRALLTEGYQLDVQPAFVVQTIEAAKQAGCAVYFTLSGPHCVAHRRAELCRVIDKIDVLFGNEDEFAVLDLPPSKLPRVSVRTKGAKGVDVWVDGQVQSFSCEACASVVNTNGAGDAFAAGFLYARHKGADVAECVRQGHEIALKVIQNTLAYLPAVKKPQMRRPAMAAER